MKTQITKDPTNNEQLKYHLQYVKTPPCEHSLTKT